MPFRLKTLIFATCFLVCIACKQKKKQITNTEIKTDERWTEEKANSWYAKQPWLVGTNFGPSNAINQLQMWQEDTFDLETIDKELELSASIGMNTHRVFLHNLLWEQDSIGFLNRIDKFLDLTKKHNIKPMLVLFDGVWHPNPKLGKQPEPTPHKHNSGWVQSPGAEYLKDKSTYPKLESYVKGVISHFANDERVLIWDIFNEPENENSESYPELELKDKYDRALDLIKFSFEWAREVNPSQPITSGVWGGFIGRDGMQTDSITSISKFMLEKSDIITFHTYQEPEVVPLQITFLKQYNRPILCTEYLARSRNNNFETILTLFKEHNIGAYNWGFVSGKTNTIYHWDSWKTQMTREPEQWHHDIFRSNYTPYKQDEVDLIKSLISTNKKNKKIEF